MPRLNVGRSVQAEANVARRIAHERERRDQSYEALAQAMTSAGCAIAGSSIYKIEKGDPPRRVSVDELVTLAQVWDLTIEDMLTPMELIDQRRAQELVETFQRNERNMGQLFNDVFGLFVDLIDLGEEQPELYDYVMNHWLANPRGLPPAPSEDRAGGPDDYERAALVRSGRAMRELRVELMMTARMWRAGRRGELSPDDEDRIRALLEEETDDGQH